MEFLRRKANGSDKVDGMVMMNHGFKYDPKKHKDSNCIFSDLNERFVS